MILSSDLLQRVENKRKHWKERSHGVKPTCQRQYSCQWLSGDWRFLSVPTALVWTAGSCRFCRSAPPSPIQQLPCAKHCLPSLHGFNRPFLLPFQLIIPKGKNSLSILHITNCIPEIHHGVNLYKIISQVIQ